MPKYISREHSFECEVPDGWAITDDGEKISFADPSDRCAITISVLRRDDQAGTIRANEHLRRYLTQGKFSAIQVFENTPRRATAFYMEESGRNWSVLFLENESLLLLATLNATSDVSIALFDTAAIVIDTLVLK